MIKRAGILSLIVAMVLTGCGGKSRVISETLEPLSEETTRYEVPTPPDEMDRVLAQVREEMRVFDVNLHHETIYAAFVDQISGLEEAAAKTVIFDTVATQMDAYFYERIRELLSGVNPDYAYEDVETLFNSTTRTSLYELITLYEWTYYQNHR